MRACLVVNPAAGSVYRAGAIDVAASAWRRHGGAGMRAVHLLFDGEAVKLRRRSAFRMA